MSSPGVNAACAWTASRVRQTFLDYFLKENSHTFVPSSPTIPHDDPSLLFTNSGMAQFKPIFQGVVDPSSAFGRLKRVANSQKCIRAGGKHNDLDDVGKDTYHHTFFEMLGNWSFGDYFKKEAIHMSWDLLTRVYGLAKDRLYVTYFAGNEALGLPADIEARDLWIAEGVLPSRVIPYGMKENFWEMGETGPCGPCSEIHYDRIGGGRDASSLVNADDPMVLEIWNNVFMQYNREADRSLRVLPSKHIDTGMGFERLVSVLQDCSSNYDTDVFASIFHRIHQLTGTRPYEGRVGAADSDLVDMAYRVVADHIRTLTVAISDGGVPSNEGRGYVLRRILRRGVRYAVEKLGARPGFFSELVDTVIESFGNAFPELCNSPTTVKQLLMEEETQFLNTLERGIRLFRAAAAAVITAGGTEISGATAFLLKDTYGFPYDLTKLMAEELKLTVNEDEFLEEQRRAQQLSRQRKDSIATVEDAYKGVEIDVHASDVLKQEFAVPSTDDSLKWSYASDASHPEVKGTILAFVVDGGSVTKEISFESDETPRYFGVILDRTNFYAEQGGQIHDCGLLKVAGREVELLVHMVKLRAGYVLHVCSIAGDKKAFLAAGDVAVCEYDQARRLATMRNHTATHLLNHAIRQVTGKNCNQEGSLVTADRLRMDVSLMSALTDSEIAALEDHVQKAIDLDLPVFAHSIPLSTADHINGIRKDVAEQYPDPVRVVSSGIPVLLLAAQPEEARWREFAIECCGGTHMHSTGGIVRFVITQETTKSKGTRRLFAVTGDHALKADSDADLLRARFTELSSLTTIDSKALKQLKSDVDKATINAVLKNQLRSDCDGLMHTFNSAEKARKAAQAKVAESIVASTLAATPSHEMIVLRLDDISDGASALSAAVNVAKAADRSGFIYTLNSESKRIQVSCCCSSGAAITAAQWVSAVSECMLEGTFFYGGSDAVAQGTGILKGDVGELQSMAAAACIPK